MELLIEEFIKLIKISLGVISPETFPRLNKYQWAELFSMAHKQAIVGIVSKAIDILPNEKRPPREIVLKWIVFTERIKNHNKYINANILQIEQLFNEMNLSGCILKGQGIAQLYPSPELRTSGDVDIWLNGNRRSIINIVKSKCHKSHAVYHHIDGLVVNKVLVEVHFTPSYMADPFANNKLQQWIEKESLQQFNNTIDIDGNAIHVPTLAFNRVFILHHIFRHFFYEGIGLRQMMDFYYVLKQGFSEEERQDTIALYNKLKLTQFAGATIYVLQEIFGLEKKFQIIPPNANYGKVLLSEIMRGGNFGQAIVKSKYNETIFHRGWRIIKRSWKFFKYNPSEVFWIPYFKIMNNIWYVRVYN